MISAEQVRELRELTGAGMMECKKALEEAEGNEELAIERLLHNSLAHLLRLLGQAEYGLYNTVASTISMMSVLNMGFSSSYIRYYSQYKVRKDTQGIETLNGLFLIVFSLSIFYYLFQVKLHMNYLYYIQLLYNEHYQF